MSWESLPNTARVWVYQSNRLLSDEESQEIQSLSESFVIGWASHGTDLTSGAKVFHNVFVVIGVDESAMGASGCSIDTSVHFVQKLGEKFQIDFFDRMTVVLRGNDGELILQPLNDIGSEPKGQYFFDNTPINVKGDLKEWEKSITGSWVENFLDR